MLLRSCVCRICQNILFCLSCYLVKALWVPFSQRLLQYSTFQSGGFLRVLTSYDFDSSARGDPIWRYQTQQGRSISYFDTFVFFWRVLIIHWLFSSSSTWTNSYVSKNHYLLYIELHSHLCSIISWSCLCISYFVMYIDAKILVLSVVSVASTTRWLLVLGRKVLYMVW